MAISMRLRLEIIRWKCSTLFLGDSIELLLSNGWAIRHIPLKVNFQRPVNEILFQTIWLKLGRWNYGDQPLRHRKVKQNRTINTTSVAVWNIWLRQFYTAKHPRWGNQKFRVFIERTRQDHPPNAKHILINTYCRVCAQQSMLTHWQLKTLLTLEMHFGNNVCIDCKRY